MMTMPSTTMPSNESERPKGASEQTQIDEMIDSIQAGTLPNMALETLELASQAVAASSSVGAPSQHDVAEWARKLAEDVLSKND